MECYSLKNKKALVCGSTKGIGKAIAQEFARQGASVTLLARNEKLLKEVCGGLSKEKEQKHSYFSVDFSEKEKLKNSLGTFLKEEEPYHILVNNTGGPPAGEIVEATIEELSGAFTQHLIASHLLLQALLPGMKKNQYGRVINIISTSVKQPIPGLGVSNSIRGAMGNWAKTLAGELGSFGITVNNILPGATKTERLDEIFSSQAEKKGVPIEKIIEGALQKVPMNRFADPQEIAYAASFLASPAASYVTGINLPVDGGRTSCL